MIVINYAPSTATDQDFDPEAVKHPYESTACQHGKHERCRLMCKFCHAPCGCDCHSVSDDSRSICSDRHGEANQPGQLNASSPLSRTTC